MQENNVQLYDFKLPDKYPLAKRQYLKRKHTGGVVNAKGNTYEEKYLVAQILCRMGDSPTTSDDAVFYPQVNNRAVDDLVIQEANKHLTYHQLKDSQKLQWSDGGKTNTILDDFKDQETISNTLGEDYELKIVVSNPECEILSNAVPTELKHTSIEHFPNSTYYELAQQNHYYVEGLNKILPKDATLDQRINVCKIIVGHIGIEERNPITILDVWNSLNHNKEVFTVAKITSETSTYLPECLMSISKGNIKQAKYTVLDKRMDVEMQLINGAKLTYSCELTQEIEEKLFSNQHQSQLILKS